MEEQVKITGVYRHFSGNYYFVENVGFDSESKERLVIYKPLYHRDDEKLIFVTPEAKFLGDLESSTEGNLTGQSKRFVLCEKIAKNYLEKN